MLPPKVIVSPIDFSVHSDDALKTAANLASRFGSELCLVHVVPALPKLPFGVSIFKEARLRASPALGCREELAIMVDEISRRGVTAKYAVGTANDTAWKSSGLPEHHAGGPDRDRNPWDDRLAATGLWFGDRESRAAGQSSVLVLRAQPEREAGSAVVTADSMTSI